MLDLSTDFYIAGAIGAGIAILLIWLWSLSYREQKAVQRMKQRREEDAAAIRARDLLWGWAVQRTFFPTKQNIIDTKEAIAWSNIYPVPVSVATKDIYLVHHSSGTIIEITEHKTPLSKKVSKS